MIKTAFDCIRADERLKQNTLTYIKMRKSMKKRVSPLPFAAVLACIAVFAAVYFTPSAYLGVDVNPSIELSLNRFDRVVGVRAYNADGEAVLSNNSLMHKSRQDALLILMNVMLETGYITDSGLVSVTLSGSGEGKLEKIEGEISAYMSGRHCTAQLDIFPVSGEIRSSALEMDVSPAKYLAIQEVMEVDPYMTVERCKGHSISELQEMAHTHSEDTTSHRHRHGCGHG